MLNRDIIQNTGFCNTTDGAAVTGFQLQVRNPNYRGLASSLVDGVDVTVDGHVWSHEDTTVVLQGVEFTLPELRRSQGHRWALDELLTVTVALPGGLTPGVHRVAVDILHRAPYIPIEFQPNVVPSGGYQLSCFHCSVTGCLLSCGCADRANPPSLCFNDPQYCA